MIAEAGRIISILLLVTSIVAFICLLDKSRATGDTGYALSRSVTIPFPGKKQEPTMRKAALLLIAGFVLVSMNIRAADPPKAVEPPKAVAKGNLDFTGRIEAATLTIRPRVTGYLGKILVKEGATVKQGDLLAEIDPRPYKARLDEARAKLTVAKASLKAARVNHDRLVDAVKKGIVNPSELAVSEAEKEKAAAMVEAEKATVSLVELDLSFTRLTSPMDGRIGRFAETAGNLVVA